MAVVTELTPQKKNQNRFNLFIEGKFYSGVSVATVARYGLYKDKVLSDDDLNLITLNDLEERIFDRVCNYLSKVIKSKYQIIGYMDNIFYKKNGDWWSEDFQFDQDKIKQSILERVERIGLINDSNYAKSLIRERSKLRPKSKYALKMELLSKGIDSQLADETLTTDLEDEFELLKRAYFKRYKEAVLVKEDSKKVDFLRRKGFSWDLISRFIDEQEVN